MYPRTFNLCALLALLGAAPGFAGEPAPDRLWPVAAEPAVSSSFCEYREGHLHAGLDVRTYGEEGVPCLAAADGYVSRVRATAVGYGKAVYIRLDDGQTLVYAHLAEFAPAIDSLAFEQQKRAGRYRVDFRPEPGAVRVRRGDVVGYSGGTGGVDPHLHFEVRNAREHPLDPFGHGFALTDTLRPSFERIVFVPLEADARINGRCYPAEYAAREVGPGRFVVEDTVLVAGAVGIQTRCVDYLNARSGRLAPRYFEVHAGEHRVSRIEFEAISFGHSGQVDFVYDVGRVRNDRRYYYQLYERDGESLWNREFVDGGRLPVAANDRYGLRVTAADAAGNAATLSVPVRVSRALRRGAGLPYRSELGNAYAYGSFLVVDPPDRSRRDRTAPGMFMASPDSTLWGIDVTGPGFAVAGMNSPVFEVGSSGGPRARPTRTWVSAAVPGEFRRSVFPGFGMELRFDDRSAFGEQVVYARREDADGGGAPEPRTPAVRIGPSSMTLRADMEIRFSVSGADSTDAIYRQSERSGKWVHYASIVEDDTVSTMAKRPGVYAVFPDFAAPVVRDPRVTSRPHYATGGRIGQIEVAIEDDGSGVDHGRCAVFLNGIRQIAEWDGRVKKLFVLLRDESIIGPQALTVVAYDNIGHRTQLDTNIVIPERP